MIATADDPAPIPAARTRLAPPAYRRYETLAEYRAALDELVGLAQRTLWLFDITLEPRFGSRERVGQLRNFLRRHPENRLRIAVHDARPLARDCPRLIELQRQHGGAFAIHETTGTARSASDPLAIADAMHALRRFHHAQSRSALITDDPAGARALLDRYEQIWESSEPAVSPTTLGL